MKAVFLTSMILFGITSIVSGLLTFLNESLIINHEPIMATLFFGGGFMGFISSILFSLKVN
jgi:hypothetical protein